MCGKQQLTYQFEFDNQIVIRIRSNACIEFEKL